jgi:DNA-binding NarL/FixJ family response regulator
MILTIEGEVLCFNASARDIILTNSNVDKHFADIHRQLLSTDKGRSSRNSDCSGAPQTPILQLLISQGANWYGLRGFWLETASESPSSLIGVVIEQINLRRLDLHKAQRLNNLSPRERTVVTALADGKTDKQIASTIGVTPETVRWYLKNIRTKMQVSTRTGILHKLLFM